MKSSQGCHNKTAVKGKNKNQHKAYSRLIAARLKHISPVMKQSANVRRNTILHKAKMA